MLYAKLDPILGMLGKLTRRQLEILHISFLFYLKAFLQYSYSLLFIQLQNTHHYAFTNSHFMTMMS